MKKFLVLVGFLFIGAGSTYAQSSNSNVKSQLVGKWYLNTFTASGKTQVIPPSVQSKVWLEFNSDGGCSYTSIANGQVINCTWSYNPSTNILTQQDVGSTGSPDEDTVTSISGTQLLLNDKADNVTATYSR